MVIVEISTERLLLRALRPDDAHGIVEKLNDFEVSRNLARVPYPYHRSDAVEFIAWSAGLDARSAICAITLKGTPAEIFGMISYEFSEARQNAELGYWLAKPMWGNGFGREAATAIVHHAFARPGHVELVSCFHNDNPVSGKILRSTGFEEVAQCRHYSKAQGCEVDVTNMRLTRDRWNYFTTR